MITKEVYRVKNGNLLTDGITIPFEFGLIFSSDGLLTVDLYINEDFNLLNFIDDKKNRYWNRNYQIDCITEEKNKLEIDNLSFTKITPHHSKVKMICYGKMKHTKIKEIPKIRPDENSKLHYVELEGLKMEFCDITEQINARCGKEIKGFNNWKRDHSSTLLSVNHFGYNQIFYRSEKSDNIVVEYPNETNNTLFYKNFLNFKNEYVSVLSFLNGAEVRIRREFTGSYYTVGKPDSEVVITYSFPQVINRRYNKYIPLNDPFSRAENILNKFLIFSFDKYRAWNEKLDLNSIVFYLNNSEQTKSMEEKVFIQIIAFERLSAMYAEYLGNKEEFLPSKEEYQPIKEKLLEIIDFYKDQFGNAYDTIKSKVGNLNQIKRLSTTDKMYRLINDMDIFISQEIHHLIDIIRHKTIHRGEIGEGKEALLNFYLLDELIREIILKLVEYKGKRNSLILLKNNK